MGNSEVGHTNIGARAGWCFRTSRGSAGPLRRGTFFQNPAYLEAIQACREWRCPPPDGPALRTAGSTATLTTPFALLDLAQGPGIGAGVHPRLPRRAGRLPTSGLGYVRQLQSQAPNPGSGADADVMGRCYAMDRPAVEPAAAYNAVADGRGPFFSDPLQAIQASYDASVTDEFMEPVICTRGGTWKRETALSSSTSALTGPELTRALVDPAFPGLKRPRGVSPSTSCAPRSTMPPCPT